MKRLFFCILVFQILLVGCGDEVDIVERVSLSSLDDVPATTWAKLSEKKVYFGHQSVGDNVIDGIKILMEVDNVVKLNIKMTKDPGSFNSPVFAHSSIGKNGDIDLKFADFSRNIEKGIGHKVDIAFLKLCFWDVRRETNVGEVFNDYKKTIKSLQQKYPETVFVHLTVPLMSRSNEIFDKMRRLIRPDNDDLDNINRNELNELLIREYSGKEPFFDIAGAESTLPDGSRSFFMSDKSKYYYLPSAYTDDGGHLNTLGQKHVAEQLLITLAHIVEKK